MRLAAFARAGVTGVLRALVFDVERERRKRRFELRAQADCHIGALFHALTLNGELAAVCQAFRFLVF